MAEDEWALKAIGAPMALRSREVVEREILPALNGQTPEIIAAVKTALLKKLFGDKGLEVRNRQALLLGRPEIDYLTQLARDAAAAGSAKEAEAVIEARIGKGDGRKNLAAMREVAFSG